MQALNLLTKKDNRDLTEAEKLEYAAKKALAEALNELEQELESAPTPAAELDAPPRPSLAERVLAWRIR